MHAGRQVPPNGRIARNLMLAANYMQSNILHFYHLAGQDYFQGPDTVPFVPRYRHPDLRLSPRLNALAVDEYIEALEVRQICHEMVALFGGRIPHVQGLLGGGAAEIPSRKMLLEFGARLLRVREFVEERYLPLVYAVGEQYPDMYELAHGYRNALCVGVFPRGDGSCLFNSGVYLHGRDAAFDGGRIFEDVRYSWFTDQQARTPLQEAGVNVPDLEKPDAYSFIKAPVYAGEPGRGRAACPYVDQRQAPFAMRERGCPASVRHPCGELSRPGRGSGLFDHGATCGACGRGACPY